MSRPAKVRTIGVVYVADDIFIRPQSIVAMEGVTRGFFKVRLYTRIHLTGGQKILVKKNIYAVQSALQEYGEQ